MPAKPNGCGCARPLLTTLAVLGTVALIYLMFLIVIRPLERLHLGIQRLASGDFSSRVPVETRRRIWRSGRWL